MGYTVTWADQKLNGNEIAKLNKDGLDVFKDLPELVKHPFSEIDPSYYMYFKYAGLTVQKPQSAGMFMLRVKIPGGRINVKQGEHLAWIANEYGHNVIDLTTREAVQYHWAPFNELLKIFQGLNDVGLTTVGAEGDITRNVVDNPLSGIDPDELFDTRSIVMDVYRRFQGNYDYSNLPRKFKISISTDIHNNADYQINDLAFIPAVKTIRGRQVQGFNVFVGGGLGSKPQLAQQMNIFVRPNRVADIAEVVCGLYRDHGFRRSRSKARLKFLIKDWGIDEFERLVRKQLPRLPYAGETKIVDWNKKILGIHPQKQQGYYYAGISVPAGRMSGDDFRAVVELAAKYGKDEIRFDDKQNMIIPWIAEQDLEAFKAEPILQRYSVKPGLLADYGTTCTGAEYCNLANAHTKSVFKPLIDELDARFSLDVPMRITMTGCGSNCAHRSIADIGLEGVHARTPDKKQTEGYRLAVGGSLEGTGHFNEQLKGTLSAQQLPDALSAIINDYQDNREGEESFYHYFNHAGVDHFQEVLNNYLSTQTEVLR